MSCVRDLAEYIIERAVPLPNEHDSPTAESWLHGVPLHESDGEPNAVRIAR
jgi:hypothetical protein